MPIESLKERIVFITGASRGIGRAIALRCAHDGATVILAAKTADPHEKLPGTIYSVAEEITAAGGRAIPIQLDIRDEEKTAHIIHDLGHRFSRIDVFINNASAIKLSPFDTMTAKEFDLMQHVNGRGTFFASQAALPWLAKSDNPHILNISPPLNLNPRWFKDYLGYGISKYAMSFCVLGMAAALEEQGIAVNALWPRTIIATSAIEFNFPKNFLSSSRKPEIMADAAHIILLSDAKEVTGHFFIDEEVLRNNGITDLKKYAHTPGHALQADLFLD